MSSSVILQPTKRPCCKSSVAYRVPLDCLWVLRFQRGLHSVSFSWSISLCPLTMAPGPKHNPRPHMAPQYMLELKASPDTGGGADSPFGLRNETAATSTEVAPISSIRIFWVGDSSTRYILPDPNDDRSQVSDDENLFLDLQAASGLGTSPGTGLPSPTLCTATEESASFAVLIRRAANIFTLHLPTTEVKTNVLT